MEVQARGRGVVGVVGEEQRGDLALVDLQLDAVEGVDGALEGVDRIHLQARL